ncbi:hypothetical protein J6TS2_16400 [Heyndrickxia sporothermodurans]|nr:hypothetical protein J6TS2_16400 [Heyndrickxia sporothermodurans]
MHNILNEELIIFGTGSLANKLTKELQKYNANIQFFVDNNKMKQNQFFLGYPIYHPSILNSNMTKKTKIVIASSFYEAIEEQLLENGFKKNIDFVNVYEIFGKLIKPQKMSGYYHELFNLNYEYFPTIDDVGVVFKKEKKIYRAIFNNNVKFTKEILSILKERDFYQEDVVKTNISNIKIPGYPLILEHKYIEYCSTSEQWSMSMFKDAALFLLNLLIKLHMDNLTLKDAHGLNIVFSNNKYTLIDFGSIIKGRLNVDTIDEFIQCYINPMLMFSKGKSRDYYHYNQKGFLPKEMIRGYLFEKENIEYIKKYEDVVKKIHLGKLVEAVELLRNWIMNISQGFQLNESMWANYQDSKMFDNLLERKYWNIKQKKVMEFVEEINPKNMIDIAGNNGWYSMAAEKLFNINSVLVDADMLSVDRAYQYIKIYNSTNLPVVMDFAKLNNDKGFLINNSKYKFDLVLSLAIIHHLVFSNHLSFFDIRNTLYEIVEDYLIIEFIDRHDEYVSKWLNSYFDWYNISFFKEVFQEKFMLISKENISESRTLFLFKKF